MKTNTPLVRGMNAALVANRHEPVIIRPEGRFPHASYRQLAVAVAILLLAGLLAYVTVSWVTGGPSSFAGVLENQGASALDFPNSGPVVKIFVSVGEHVNAGQVLAAQNTQGAQSQVADDQAVLAADKAKLAALQAPQLSSAQQQLLALQVQKAQNKLEGDQTTASAAATSADAQVAASQKAVINAELVLNQDKGLYSAQCPNGLVIPPAGADSATLAAYEACVRLSGQVTQDNSAFTSATSEFEHAEATAQQTKDSGNAQVASDQTALQIAQNQQNVQTSSVDPSAVSAAEADVASAQAQLDRDRQALQALVLYAPQSGVIGVIGGSVGTIDGPDGIHSYTGPVSNQSNGSPSINLFPTSGGNASSVNNSASSSQPLFTLDSSSYIAVVQVGESEVTKLHRGSPGKATINAIHSTVGVQVTDIVPVPVHGTSSVQYDVKVEGQFPASVLPGMSVSVVFP